MMAQGSRNGTLKTQKGWKKEMEHGAMLGMACLNDKESLSKLTKEQLIECILSEERAKDELMDKIIHCTTEELVEFQKEIRLYKGLAKIFGI